MKTNKSITKRFKMTRKGKVLIRKAGQNHFNAKERRRKQLNKKRMLGIALTNKTKSRYLIK